MEEAVELFEVKKDRKSKKEKKSKQEVTFKKESIMYCAFPAPGKSVMVPTVELKTPRDLAMVQGAGVAEPCKGIEKKPDLAYKYTNKGRTIACISNGTSVLGLGNIGAAASKPDIEGKSVIFK